MLPGFDLRYHIALRWSAGVGLIALAIDMSLLWSERQNRIASDRYVRNRRGEVSKSSGLGNPTPTNSTVWWCLGFLSVQSVESDESVIQTKRTCRPSGAKCAGDSLVQRVGEPNPYASSFACSRSNFRASRFTYRPSGAFVYLVHAACYKHVAPQGLQKGKRENRADSRLLYTLRSSGARRLDVLPSIDISLLWSER